MKKATLKALWSSQHLSVPATSAAIKQKQNRFLLVAIHLWGQEKVQLSSQQSATSPWCQLGPAAPYFFGEIRCWWPFWAVHCWLSAQGSLTHTPLQCLPVCPCPASFATEARGKRTRYQISVKWVLPFVAFRDARGAASARAITVALLRGKLEWWDPSTQTSFSSSLTAGAREPRGAGKRVGCSAEMRYRDLAQVCWGCIQGGRPAESLRHRGGSEVGSPTTPTPPAHSQLAKRSQPQMNRGCHFGHRFYLNACPKYMEVYSFISVCLSSSLLTNWHRSRNQDCVLPSSYQPGESHHIFKLPFSKTRAEWTQQGSSVSMALSVQCPARWGPASSQPWALREQTGQRVAATFA